MNYGLQKMKVIAWLFYFQRSSWEKDEVKAISNGFRNRNQVSI